MAKIKYKNMIIEVKSEKSGKIISEVISSGDVSQDKVDILNKNLQSLTKAYIPTAGTYVLSATNSIALWIANGLGGEILEYDEVKSNPDHIY